MRSKAYPGFKSIQSGTGKYGILRCSPKEKLAIHFWFETKAERENAWKEQLQLDPQELKRINR